MNYLLRHIRKFTRYDGEQHRRQSFSCNLLSLELVIFSPSPGNHMTAVGGSGSGPVVQRVGPFDQPQDTVLKLKSNTVYRSFVTYRTRFSQVFSYIKQLRQKDSRQSRVTL